MKRRISAIIMALLMVISTVLGVNVGNVHQVKADDEATIIIHYQRDDNDYDGWNIWAWGGSVNEEQKFEYEDSFGKVCVINSTTACDELGFIIRKGDWEEKDFDGDQFIPVTAGFAEVWITSGVEGFEVTPPAGAEKFDVSGLTVGESETPAVSEAADGQVQINLHYHRFDKNYEGWNVWFWPEGGDGTGNYFTSEDDFGKVVTYNVDASAKKAGFIVRLNEWEAKDVDADRFIDLTMAKDGVIDVYVVEGTKEIYFDPDDADLSPKIMSASLVSAKRIAVRTTVPVNTEAEESMSIFKVIDEDGNEYELMNLFSEEGTSSAFNINLQEKLDLTKSYKVVSDVYGEMSVTYADVYNTEEFDEAFYYDGDDLGAVYSKDKTVFKVWSPFATSVKVKLFKDGNETEAYETVDMTMGEKGVWEATVTKDLNKVYYVYEFTNNGETKEAVDVYAKAVGVNGQRGMVVDLDSTDPKGWDKDKKPEFVNATDAIIYETHVRDFTIDESSGVENKGKYLGLTEKGTTNGNGLKTALDHMIDLGITHVQLLPVYDYSPNSVDETKLDTPQFNWGYDPYNYNVPEGSYSTDPYNGEVRINEFKQMVKSFHDNDIRVIMDVVYNHTAESTNSWLNISVPGYYYRMNADGTFSSGSGCGNEIASERAMARKYIVDSVVYWATEYHIDGFRFDLMGVLDIETMEAVREALNEIDPTIMLYGEGWTGGNTLLNAYDSALKKNVVKMEGNVGAFSDDIRDGLKGSVFGQTDTGFATGKLGQEERIKSGVIAATNYPGINWAETYTDICSPWAASPLQVINYTSCHDNHTLWDKICISNEADTQEDRIKMNLLCASVVYTAQGTPFMLSGEEILRSKGGDHNSYKSSDEVNSIKWDEITNTEVYDYYKGLIEFRKNHSALRMTTADDIAKYLTFFTDVPSNVVAYSIDGKANNECADEIVIIYNANKEAVDITIPEGEWSVCIKDNKAGTDVIETVSSGKVTVGPISTMALVKGDTVMASASADNGANTVVIIVAVVVVVAVVAATGMVIMKKRKK